MPRRPGRESSSSIAKQSASYRRTISQLRKRLRELRRMHGFSYRDLEKRSGVHERQILALEKGMMINPQLVTLTRLADGLGVHVTELLAPAQSGVRTKKRPAADEDSGATVRAKKKSVPPGAKDAASNVTRLR